MSERELPGREDPEEENRESATGGINLWVVYGLIFLGLLAAIAVAVMIVLPFYEHRR